MGNPAAVGLNEVGGVTKGANQSLDTQGALLQKAKNLQSVADGGKGRNFGPAANAQYNALTAQAAASGTSAKFTSDYDVKKAQGEKSIVQGHEESYQTQSTAASATDSNFGSLNRAL